ncbi:hypothetical protein ACG04R_23925 [Roseateles sp. BYS78W]|uniref:HNH endonuclease n=1 Tax=Pelomonas candidula TaxID=3299025 RepID=A0ABW7HIM8_9BURK
MAWAVNMTRACKGCGSTRALVNAHVLPHAFYARMAKADGALQHLELGRYRKKSWLGFYDPEILCSSCDNRLSILDEYGAQVLLTSFDEPARFHRDSVGRIVAIDAAHVDRDRILRFFVSILWRAALSRKGPYRNVDLHGVIK